LRCAGGNATEWKTASKKTLARSAANLVNLVPRRIGLSF